MKAATNLSTSRQSAVSPLDKVLAYQNEGVILRIEEKLGLSREKAEELFDDAKRFLYLVSKNPGKSFSPSKAIDEAWHHFILFTKEYAAFCKNHFGFFIHHVPNTSEYFVTNPKNATNTVAVARTLFGNLSENWGKHANGDTCVGGSCSSDCTQCGGTTNCQTGQSAMKLSDCNAGEPPGANCSSCQGGGAGDCKSCSSCTGVPDK